MSKTEEISELINKFISALTIFSERSAALEKRSEFLEERNATSEARILSELGSMRSDINQLKNTVLNENAVFVPQVMEQQRMTMIELIRQIQPNVAATKTVQQAPIQPPTIADTPPRQQTPPSVAIQQPAQQVSIQPSTIATPQSVQQVQSSVKTPQSVQEVPKVQSPVNVTPVQQPSALSQEQVQSSVEISQPIQEVPKVQSPVNVTPIQQPIVPSQEQIVSPQPTQKSVEVPLTPLSEVQPPTNVTPVQPQAITSGNQLKDGEWNCPKCCAKNASEQSECLNCKVSTAETEQASIQQTPTQQKPTVFDSQTFKSASTTLFSALSVKTTPSSAQKTVNEEKTPVSFSVTPSKSVSASPAPVSNLSGESTTLFFAPPVKTTPSNAQKTVKEEKTPVSFLFTPAKPTIASPVSSSNSSTSSSVQNTVKEEKAPVSFSFAPIKPVVASPAPSFNLFGGPSQKPQDQKPQTPVNFSFAPKFGAPKATITTPVALQGKGIFGSAFQGNSTSAFGAAAPAKSFSALAGNTSANTSGNTSGNTSANTSGNTSGNNGLWGNAGSNAPPKQFTTFRGKGPSIVESPEKFVPDDSKFKRQDIALPGLVGAQTGEENEEVLFVARCRLYRFIPGADVKERGTGDLKILKNRGTGKVRCVMRAESVMKVCANFEISPGFQVNNTKRGENVLTWACRDHSDPGLPNGENMTLICRFKDTETAKQFKAVAQSASVN